MATGTTNTSEGASNYDGNFEDKEIELWKMRKLIKSLEAYRGNGTSMISIFIPPKDQIAPVSKKLTDELGAAQNIKSRVNRQSVIAAITSVQAKLKLYHKPPPNGLVIYCGEIITEEGKEKKVNIDFEPFKPISNSLYFCGNKFSTEGLSSLLENDDKFGFIIMDGHGSLFGTLQGDKKEVLSKFDVDLPKKHGRGGQSALRFARLRLEKRHNYVRKVAETAVTCFITNDKVTVSGIVLAGSADFKSVLGQSDMFDQRLQAKIINIVDISYGGENGFNQAIELSAECLRDVKFIQEKNLINKLFEEIAKDSGLYCFGIEYIIKALEIGAVETILVWENLDLIKCTIKTSDNEKKELYLRPDQIKEKSNFSQASNDFEIIEQLPFLEWLADNYKGFGAKLEIVTDKTQEGSQLCKGFGGIACLLRYRVQELEGLESDYENELSDMNYDFDDY